MSPRRGSLALRLSALVLPCALALTSTTSRAEPPPPPPPPPPPKEAPAPAKNAAERALDKVVGATSEWFERIKIRGYTQIRYNRFFESNEKLVNLQGDKSIGKDGGFLIRRARLILHGDVHPHLSIYLQPDFASTADEQPHVTILRDWYADVFVDEDKELRFRVGQSKVPYGFENMQSSQNRAPFDRSDALNSAVKDERDLGIFAYYAPKRVRALFKRLVDDGLKGSGDYGVVALGVYNGQTANKLEKNDSPHLVARVDYPFQIGGQILEIGVGGHSGKFVVSKDENIGGGDAFRDARVHASAVLYPQPIGLQVEYNIGVGPELNRKGTAIQEGFLYGGYAMAMAKFDSSAGNFVPYVRGVMYDGGRKFETNAPRYKVREVELGLEYQVFKALELTAAFTFAERTFPAPPYQQESGRFLRLQVQFNF